jgi:hypothetical protein
MLTTLRLALACAATQLLSAATTAIAGPPIERLKLPPGFEISVFAEGVKDARSMALGEKGWLIVSTRTAGNV